MGTIEDNQLQTTKSASSDVEMDQYKGLVSAVAISHNKVELKFSPISGNPQDIIYHFFINNSDTSIQITGNSLKTNSAGLYSYTLDGLSINTTYSFQISTENIEKNELTSKSDALFSSTFSNNTADFNGVVSAKALKGQQGKYSIRVSWTLAGFTGPSQYSPDMGDTIGYEVTYMPVSEGLNNFNDDSYVSSSKISEIEPSNLTTTTYRSTETYRDISGLDPNTEYFFRVRAIHKGYVHYYMTSGYKREMNSKVVSASTLAETGTYDFDSSSVKVSNALSDDGLDQLIVSWDSATGEFYNYRLYVVPVTDDTVSDKLTEADLDVLNGTSSYVSIDANLSSYTVSSLSAYSWYQVKVVTCADATCGSGARLLSNIVYKRTIPFIAPFGGIMTLNNPSDVNNLDQFKINFDAPVTSAGYLTDLELWCYENSSDSSPVLMEYGSTISGSGKSNCDGLENLTQSPSTFNLYKNFEELNIQGMTIGSEYCFSLVPVIDDPLYTYRDMDSAVVKCFVPEIKTPRVKEFPGRVAGCNVSDTSMTITWPKPTGGLYTNFAVFWKEADGTSFKFSDAITPAAGYTIIDGLSDSTLTYTLNNLTPGKSYHMAVLPYLEDSGTKYYAEFNAQTTECSIALPIAEFQEWVHIMALGPKVDGRVPKDSFGNETFIIETLDDDINGGSPLEVLVDNAGDIDGNYNLNRSSTGTFNGVYGALDNDTSNTLYQFSNTGIIRFGFEDVKFYNGTLSMNDLIAIYEPVDPGKSSRKFGYKVYRSENNKLNWVELTSDNYDFQTLSNRGLVKAQNRLTKARNNDVDQSKDVVIFTDYSVASSTSSGNTDRARIYYYQIVPVFNDIKIPYEEGKTSHIIKITLPPKNMALVHRLMANRTLCLEMGKDIDKSEGAYYSCDYNGVGASSLDGNGLVGSTVYDQGGDLLVDRFELGCNFTRGNPASYYDTSLGLENFTDTSFKGCVTNIGPYDETNIQDPSMDYSKVISGDCFGRDYVNMAENACSSADHPKDIFAFPGATGGTLDCSLGAGNYESSYEYEKREPQSEFAAVYYVRRTGEVKRNIRGANGGVINYTNTLERASGCYVNLHGIDQTDGNKIKQRWIDMKALFDDRLEDSVTNDKVTLIDKTLDEITSSSTMYNSSDLSAPSINYGSTKRYTASSPLGRILASNNPKLPPLRGLAQEDLNDLCEQYQVEVGYEVSGTFYSSSDVKNKRIIRKKEQIAASAWPDISTYDESFVTSVEDGTLSSSYVLGVGTDADGCVTGSRFGALGITSFTVGDSLKTLFPHTTTSGIGNYLITGSSTLDGDGRNRNSQRCTSKFGIQDIVGNVAEFTSDQIYCDFSGESLYLGVDGNVGSSIPYDGITRETYRYFKNLLTAWVYSAPTTGSCSTVEAGGSRGLSFTTGGTLFNSIYDGYGDIDTNVIGKTKDFDQESVLAARNGDGAFLDFGQSNLGPPLSLGDSLALTTDGVTDINNRRARYFNPALGMPLECTNSSCVSSDDNLAYATQAQIDNTFLGLDPTNYVISNFPINNSQILNDGIREISTSDTLTSPNTWGNTFNYINSVSASGAFTIDATHPTNYIERLNANGSSDVVTAHRVDWRVGRSSPLYMVYGGNGSSSKNGRYSFNMKGTSRNTQARYLQDFSSGRCVVKINEE